MPIIIEHNDNDDHNCMNSAKKKEIFFWLVSCNFEIIFISIENNHSSLCVDMVVSAVLLL